MTFSELLNSTPVIVGLLTLLAGAAIPVGGMIAWLEHIRPAWLEEEFRHFVIAFGGGALLSAVALVLVPEGSAKLSMVPVAICFAAGAIAFMALDIFLAKIDSPAAQLAAMLADFVPEALALGAAFAAGEGTGPLLALLIGIQNLPEGFNAFRELADKAKVPKKTILTAFCGLAVLGPVAGLTGYYVLAAYQPVVGGIMLFAAGGILYLTIEDIAPQAVLSERWAPPLGAVAGFLLGLIGDMSIG